jgi:hypothetical protein
MPWRKQRWRDPAAGPNAPSPAAFLSCRGHRRRSRFHHFDNSEAISGGSSGPSLNVRKPSANQAANTVIEIAITRGQDLRLDEFSGIIASTSTGRDISPLTFD